MELSGREHLSGVLAGQQHELPPAVAMGQADADVRAGRVAVQRGVRRIERVVAALHHHPLAGMGVAAESDAKQSPDGAASAVRTDNVVSQDAHSAAVRGEHAEGDVAIILFQRLHVVPEQDLH